MEKSRTLSSKNKNLFIRNGGQTSRIKEFYKKTHSQRLDIIKNFASLNNLEIATLKNLNSLAFENADRMIENVISTMSLPLGIATNFIINGKDYLIPMATEEPSIIAAASKAAKIARLSGGFSTIAAVPIMIGQVQLVGVKNFKKAKEQIEQNKKILIDLANQKDPLLVKLGGGALNIETKEINTIRGKMLIVHLLINVKDAMGANIIDSMVEEISPTLEKICGGVARLKIVSNLPVHRIVQAKAIWKKDTIGEDCIEGILDAYAFALADPYRQATHNKGIMNGIDAVAIATGNDFRALEAGAHTFVTLNNSYKLLTKYYKTQNGDLVSEIRLPLSAGIVGGITQIHPTAKICLKILGVKTATELAQIMATVGLAQNFAALKALVTEGIQAGHMKLHNKKSIVKADQ